MTAPRPSIPRFANCMEALPEPQNEGGPPLSQRIKARASDAAGAPIPQLLELKYGRGTHWRIRHRIPDAFSIMPIRRH